MKTKWGVSKLKSLSSHIYKYIGFSSLFPWNKPIGNIFFFINRFMNISSWIFPVVPTFQLHQSVWHISYQFIFVSYVWSFVYTLSLGWGAILVYHQIICQMARFSRRKKWKIPRVWSTFSSWKKKLSSYFVFRLQEGGRNNNNKKSWYYQKFNTDSLTASNWKVLCVLFKHSLLPVCTAYNCCLSMKEEKEIMKDVTATLSTHYKFSKGF